MEKLSVAEEEAMQIIWRLGETNIKAVMDELPEAIPYTTLASTVKKLEKKNFLQSRLVGNVHLYSPLVKEAAYKKKFMHQIVQDYFANSYKEVVSFFVENKKLSKAELQEIIKLIENEN